MSTVDPDATEHFSAASGRDAIEALFDALPKSRQYDHLGELNEALVVYERLVKRARITDQGRAV